MRGATHVKWAACAAAVALAATACGGGDSGGGGGGADGIVSSSWGDPQNPLEPANTNEVQGGKVLDMIFRGLKRYDPKTGEAINMLADKIETEDNQNFTVTVKDGWTFSNGEKITASSFVDAWNYGAVLKNNQKNAYFFGYIDGYDKVHPESGKASATKLSGLKVVDDKTFTVKLSQKFSLWPDTLGYPGLRAAPQDLLHGPRVLAQEAHRQRPVHHRQVHQGLLDEPAQVGRLPRGRQGAERRYRPQGLHRQQHRLHRPDGRQPRPRGRRARLAAQERQVGPR